MDKQRLLVMMRSLITALAEMPDGSGIQGHCYAAFTVAGYGLDEFQRVVDVLTQGGMVTKRGWRLTITPAGRKYAAAIEAALARARG